MGYFDSSCSHGLLCVSPSLEQTTPLMPSSVFLAPQPPPEGPTNPMKNWPSLGEMPWNSAITKSAWWAAMVRSGMAWAIALKMVSTTVIGKVIHLRMAAGLLALTTVPSGTITFSGRKLPSLIG